MSRQQTFEKEFQESDLSWAQFFAQQFHINDPHFLNMEDGLAREYASKHYSHYRMSLSGDSPRD